MKRLIPILLLVLAIASSSPQGLSQDTSAKGFVENLLESVLAAEGRSLSVENVSISVTGDVTVGHIEVSDDQGPWLVLDNLSVAWSPLSLFADQLEVNDISVGEAHMLRMSQSPEGGVAAPREMQDLQAARIDRLAIGTLRIDEPVLGQAVTMKLEGSGEITAAPVLIRVDLTASRRDGKKGDLGVKVDLDPRTRQFAADVTLEEEADGVIAGLLALRGEPSVELDLKAKGDVSAWKGDFSLAVDGERTIDGSASATPGDLGQTVKVGGTGTMARLLPQSLADIFNGVSTLSASAFLPMEGGAVEIDHVSLENAALSFNLSGVADWTGTRSNLVAELAAKDASAILDLPETGLLGRARIAGLRAGMRLDGVLAAPRWQVSLGWGALESDRLALKQMTATLEGRGLVPGDDPMTFGGMLKADLEQGWSGELPPALHGPLSGQLAGAWRAGDVVDITQADLTLGSVALNARGQVRPQAGSYDVAVSAKTRSPRTGNDLADRLLAGPVALEGQISGDAQRVIGLRNINLSSDSLSARASGTISAEQADLSLDANLPDLSRLHGGVTGSLHLEAGLAGSWQDLAATLNGRGTNVTLLGKAFDQPELDAKLTLRDETADGDVVFSGDLVGKPVSLKAVLSAGADGTMMLRDFSATAGSARASGALQWPSGGQPVGKLEFDAPDLAEVAPLVLTDMSGDLHGEIAMTGIGEDHKTSIRFQGRDLALGDHAAARAEGRVTIATLFDRPRPSGSISLASVRIGGQRFDIVDVDAEALTGTSLRLTASLKGRELSADAAAQVTFSADGAVANVSQLSGRTKGIAFSAPAPFEVRQRGEAISLGETVLAIGDGRVIISGKVAPRLEARLVLSSVPLSAFETATGTDGLRGALSGNVALAGTTASPEGRFDLNVSGFSLASLRDQGIGSLAGSAKGNVKGTTASLSMTANAGNDLALTAGGTIDVSPSGRIDLTVRGQTGSRFFSDRLAESGLRAEGRIDLDVRLTGITARPDIAGTIGISNGVIGDTAGQFTVRGVTGRIAISNDELTIVSLTGVTGRKGRASASGRVSFAGGMALDLQANVTSGNYTDGSFVTARYDADLAVRGGPATGIVVSGDIGLYDTKVTLSELPRRAVSPVDVNHRHAPADVKKQAVQLQRFTGRSSADIVLDLTLRARDTVSVSGRGLNVVLTGGLRLHGPIGNLAAEGGFRLFRGRLALPARSLDFERGSLTFDRNFDPLINFVAVSRRSDATITLTVSGRASEPEISVTSAPELPPEEALARLIFDNSMLKLSPLQVAQIASYVATLTGGRGGGLLSGLQSALGVDYLTVRETETGDTEVGVAKRINDRLSVGVEQTTKSNTTRVIIDLSATKTLKLRGSVDTDQSSRIGVYYEKDY